MKKMLQEFKEFAMKGSIVDLAVAVVIGGAFGKIVASLVNDIFMPIIGMLIGGHSFHSLSVTFGTATIAYGSFLQAIINFIAIAIALFMVIKMINKTKKPAKEAPAGPSETELLAEIRDLLKKSKK